MHAAVFDIRFKHSLCAPGDQKRCEMKCASCRVHDLRKLVSHTGQSVGHSTQHKQESEAASCYKCRSSEGPHSSSGGLNPSAPEGGVGNPVESIGLQFSPVAGGSNWSPCFASGGTDKAKQSAQSLFFFLLKNTGISMWQDVCSVAPVVLPVGFFLLGRASKEAQERHDELMRR